MNSLITLELDDEMYQLAPFDLIKNWQRKLSSFKDQPRATKANGTRCLPSPLMNRGSLLLNYTSQKALDSIRVAEEGRREVWNYRDSFGKTADEAEKTSEAQRRSIHDTVRSLMLD